MTKRSPEKPPQVRRWFLTVAVLTLAGLLPGCESGRPHFPAGGTVTFKKDGQRATFGSIEFRSEDQPVVVARGKIEKDGTFTVNAGQRNGTIGGWHTVVILQPVRGLGGQHKHSHGLDAAQKYADHRTTDLRVEVNAETGTEGLSLMIDELTK